MKNKRILWIVVILYVASMVAAYFITKSIVEKKDNRLRVEAYDNLQEFFSQQSRFINIGYSGKKVAYEEIPIPPKPQKTPQTYLDSLDFSLNPYEKRLEEWNDQYGDLYKMYKLKPRYVSEYSWNSDKKWSGWLFYGIESNGGQYVTQFQIYPYEVGLKKQTNSWGYYYAPSIQEAVDASFEFHTSDEKSSYINDIVRHGEIDIYSVKDRVNNEYYELWSYDNFCAIAGKKRADSTIFWTNWSDYPVASHLLPCVHFVNDYNTEFYYGGMHNGYYTVRNKYVKVAIWEIKYRWLSDHKARDLRKLQIWSFGGLSLLFLACLIPLLVLIGRENKIKNESGKAKLLRLCNPQLLLKDKPYNKELTDQANSLYKDIIATSKEDQERLSELRKIAVEVFGISFIDPNEVEILKKKCNPQKYMKPYDAEKVSLANELYSRITKTGLTYEEFVEIKEESEKL